MMSQDQIVVQAPAKINVYLKVVGRRSDGYHLLETLMQKVSLYDEITLQPCAQGIELRCCGSGMPGNRDNLVYRAAEMFLRKTKEQRRRWWSGIRMTLTKRIPVAAGLGGGSSDAAATLKGLNALDHGGCSDSELAAIGLQLGADVPFFLGEAPAAIATGIGEVLRPVPSLQGCSILLINPGFSVSTRWVYQSFALTESKIGSSLKRSQESAVELCAPDGTLQTGQWSMVARNDLEQVTSAKYPEIEQIKARVVECGAVAALMSGSGPTVFGLFDNRQRAETCFSLFKSRFTHTYLVAPVQE